jgi:ATP phosphoribosyltransferase
MAEGDDPREWSHVRVATKYPNLTRKHFEARGVQAECVKLNGAMEIAPVLGLSSRIVDLVSSGKTLKENGLVEVEVITQVSARLIANRAAFKTRAAEVAPLVEAFRSAVNPPSRSREGSGVGLTDKTADRLPLSTTPLSPPASGRGS